MFKYMFTLKVIKSSENRGIDFECVKNVDEIIEQCMKCFNEKAKVNSVKIETCEYCSDELYMTVYSLDRLQNATKAVRSFIIDFKHRMGIKLCTDEESTSRLFRTKDYREFKVDENKYPAYDTDDEFIMYIIKLSGKKDQKSRRIFKAIKEYAYDFISGETDIEELEIFDI